MFNLGDTVILNNALGMGKVVGIYEGEFFNAVNGRKTPKGMQNLFKSLGMEEEQVPTGNVYTILYNQPIRFHPRSSFETETEYLTQPPSSFGVHFEDELQKFEVKQIPPKIVKQD